MVGKIKGLLLHYDDYDYVAVSWQRLWCSAALVFLEGALAGPVSLLLGLLLVKVTVLCGIL